MCTTLTATHQSIGVQHIPHIAVTYPTLQSHTCVAPNVIDTNVVARVCSVHASVGTSVVAECAYY